MKIGCWVLLIVTAAALLVSAHAASAPPAVRPTGKEPSQALHTSTLARGRTPRRALRASGYQCCAWSQVDMYEYKAGTGDRQFERLSKTPGNDAKAMTAPAQAPGKAEKAFEPAKEGKEKPNTPKFYWRIPKGGVCGDAGGAWKDAKCTGTEICVEGAGPRPDLVWTRTTGTSKYAHVDSPSSEPKDAWDDKAVDKGVPSRGELNLGYRREDKIVYRCEERP